MAQDLTTDEYPLIPLECDGIKIKVPRRGFRSYDYLKNNETLDVCYDDNFVHKYHVNARCQGFRKVKCNQIKKLLKKNQVLPTSHKNIDKENI